MISVFGRTLLLYMDILDKWKGLPMFFMFPFLNYQCSFNDSVNRQGKEICTELCGSLMSETYLEFMGFITKTCLYNFDPLKPHFCIVKLGFTGVYIIFLISAQKHRLWYSLEPPQRGGSNEYPQSMFWAGVWKISEFFIRKFSFFGCKIFNIHLNRRVFVMKALIIGAKIFSHIKYTGRKCIVFHGVESISKKTRYIFPR